MLTRRGNLVVAAIAFAVALAAVVLIVALTSGGVKPASRNPVALGEWIYRSGTDSNGRPIAFGGGLMMRLSCASCHGSDGQGRTTPMFSAPNITYPNLTNPNGMVEPDGSRGPTYSAATLQRAISAGIDPQGNHLAWPMPQWQLTNAQWADLLAYLQTLR